MVKKFIDQDQLRDDMSYSDADLSDAMMRQASLFSHYGVLHAKAAGQVDRLKLKADVIKSKLDSEVREELADSGKKITEAMVTSEISKKAAYVEAQKNIVEAKEEEAVTKYAAEAFRHRRDMLIQLGLTQREEMKGELSIERKKAQQQAADDQLDRILKAASS